MVVFFRREWNWQVVVVNLENFKGKGWRGQRGKNWGCVLIVIYLNVIDLGLGYEIKEELIFRYCSGFCDVVEIIYDKILKNLFRNRRLVSDKVGQVCCRFIVFDDDLLFLDDNLVYYILRKYFVKRCGCI